MVAADAAALVRRNGTDPAVRDRPAIRFGERTWTHGELFEESCRFASLFLARRAVADPGGQRPFHVAVLSDNTPDYLFAFGGAALAGAAVVGLNHTRRGEHLARDLAHTDCCLLLVEPKNDGLLRGADLGGLTGGVYALDRFRDDGDPATTPLAVSGSLAAALDVSPTIDPQRPPDPDAIWGLIFTSGTSDAPKAVICSQRRFLVTGNRMAMIMGLTADDTGYDCMPMFHSNALLVGWAPSLVLGACVGVARRFSASRWLADVRRYGATYFNYVGKPLSYLVATPERPDDADNPLRVAFGNEGAEEVVAAFSRRFGVEVIDTYGATEGGIAVNHDATTPPGALGRTQDGIAVVDEDGVERPRARFDERGRLLNADECVGEIVNTKGIGAFEGYYGNPDADARTTRFGWYWSGDLGYLDDDDFLYFAGRNADWIRVDGENFPAGPIEAAVRRHPDVALAAVYGVPDDAAGDQVMACLLLRDGAAPFDPAAFGVWIDAQDSLGPKWRPRYVRVTTDFPSTGTNKVVVRSLQHQKFRADRRGSDACFVRARGEIAYRPFDAAAEAALHDRFVANGRERFWDL
jgi:fatty-acyl-CoA synthase